jgi:response regulator RpfG family c-di-GMP phosphodiesterase
MNSHALYILLIDDDIDDCNFFKKAINEIEPSTKLVIMHEGENLINYLAKNSKHPPDILFLDLNMPHKNGIECLSDLKEIKKLADIPVIIYSSSCSNHPAIENNLVHMLIDMGAVSFIRKTKAMEELKQEIHKAINMATETTYSIQQ